MDGSRRSEDRPASCPAGQVLAKLRKALGEHRDLLKTGSGRGYLLATEVVRPPGGRAVSAMGDEDGLY
jgi:hypothetical protein